MKKGNTTTAFAFKGFEKFATIEPEVLKNIVGGDVRIRSYGQFFGKRKK